MKLIYNDTGIEVKKGDQVITNPREEKATVISFSPPHKPSASGKVYIELENGSKREYYVGVIGAKWIS